MMIDPGRTERPSQPMPMDTSAPQQRTLVATPAPQPSGLVGATPPLLRHTGRALGADTEEVLRTLLGVSATELEHLRASEVI